MTAIQDRVSDLIDSHCRAHEQFRHERYRVAMAELSGQPDPAAISEVESSLTIVYGLLHESSERLAAISAELADWDINNEGEN